MNEWRVDTDEKGERVCGSQQNSTTILQLLIL